MDGDAKVICNNCEWEGRESEMKKTLFQINHLAERLDPGSKVPAGECPKCTCMVYLAKEETPESFLLRTDAEVGITYCNSRETLLDETESLLMVYEENGERPEDAIKDMDVALLENSHGVLVPATNHISVVRDGNKSDEWHLE